MFAQASPGRYHGAIKQRTESSALRGVNSASGGAFTDKPPRALIEQLDALFDGEPVAGEVAA